MEFKFLQQSRKGVQLTLTFIGGGGGGPTTMMGVTY
jgi:hypothetical protein